MSAGKADIVRRRRLFARIGVCLYFFLWIGGVSAEVLVPLGSVWNYDDSGTDLGSAWRTNGYDDSGWSVGPAELGYGDGDEATVMSYGPDSGNKYPTYYLRHAFTITDPNNYGDLHLDVIRDDGCVVYLNGQEVARSNMPLGDVSFDTFAEVGIGGGNERTPQSFILDPSALVAGNNVISVEVHQSGRSSSDLSIDLQLEAMPPPPPVPTVSLEAPEDQSVANGVTSFRCSAADTLGLNEATLYIGGVEQSATLSGPVDMRDVVISEDSPNINFEGDTSVYVDGSGPHAHVLMEFPDLFGAGANQVPPGENIVSATLEVNCTNTGKLMQLYRLTEDWTAVEATWNERQAGVPWSNPGADGSGSNAGVALPGDCTAPGIQSIDITAFVQEWSNGAPNYGMVLTDTGSDGVDMDSSESSDPPVLRVVYGEAAPFLPVDTRSLSGLSDTADFTAVLGVLEEYRWNCLVSNTSAQQSFAGADFIVNVDQDAPDEPVLVSPTAGGVVAVPTTLEVAVGDPNADPLDVTFYGRKAVPPDDFTVIALPDTQHYSEAYPELYTAQTQWIVDNSVSRNIAFVTHEGDVVENPDNSIEWDRADASMSLLDGVVPYGIGPGNHDQPTTLFNLYFPYTRYEPEIWYAGHFPADKNDNNLQLFSAGGRDFVIVHLEFCPPAAAVSWADSVLKSYPDRIGIVTTHGFMDTSGNRSVSLCPDTQYIWDDLVVPNPNVHFVLTGHENGEHYRVDLLNGHDVHQLLADYQDRLAGGEGWLRIMHFVPAEDKIYIQTYSPWLDLYEKDANSEFSIDFVQNSFDVIATLQAVASGSNVSALWSGLEADTQYEWYVSLTDSTGRTRTGPLWAFNTSGADIDPPVISNVAVTLITETSARITWTTDELSDSRVDYGPDTNYGFQTTDPATTTSHVIDLTDLQPQMTYHFSVSSMDALGNLASSPDYMFTTLTQNVAPTVSAGIDFTVTLPSSGTLDGTVTDDGLPNPPGSVSTLWSQVSGPGVASFTNAAAVDTTVSFTQDGVYVLRLTADDGEFPVADDVTVTVEPELVAAEINVRVSASSDDAEEQASGSVSLTSSDLELIYDRSDQVVGMRFPGIAIPPGAAIITADIQFQVDETSTQTTSLEILGEASDDAATFVSETGNISARPLTAASVSWSPAAWSSTGEAGPDQQTPELAGVIQEIIDRPGWSSGNALVVIVRGSGERVAESYDGNAAAAPLLHVEYSSQLPPSVNAGPDQDAELGNPLVLDGSASDDGLPNPPGVLSTLWSQVSGPGVASFADAAVLDTTVTFPVAGDYVLRLSADDGQLSASDDVTITVITAGNTAPVVDAGADQTQELDTVVNLEGSATDDGIPGFPGMLSTIWSQVSGPGVVSFADSSMAVTTATFSDAGTYILRLSAYDGELTASDEVTITISYPAGFNMLDVRVSDNDDDAEEQASGTVQRRNSDLELVTDKDIQVVGVRFSGLGIPQGATILDAYIQFEADETGSEPTSLLIQGEASDSAPVFTSEREGISLRPRTTASVSWLPLPWTTVGAAGLAERTTNIVTVIQEIVDRPGWTEGNAMVMIITGTGVRIAMSYDGSITGAPLLHVEYMVP